MEGKTACRHRNLLIKVQEGKKRKEEMEGNGWQTDKTIRAES